MDVKLSFANSTYPYDYLNTKPIDAVFRNEANLLIKEFTIFHIRQDYSGTVKITTKEKKYDFNIPHYLSDGETTFELDEIKDMGLISKIEVHLEYSKSNGNAPDVYTDVTRLIFNVKTGF